ncbi:helix-turn-helix domain-containing protein [Novosphingobium sp. G106]|uniref:helix-turn-helix domain-containing protein n=1 Tax=Novosphingobium sp. G106 TaxID=2849500 RepID=UPI001C2CF806|nr:helix-turn-helix domain-containing protein [Novosphingobium sp. G106]MBV1688847.1 helix-turn-helix domain-containing protein [Novosphingobium sp. G106]
MRKSTEPEKAKIAERVLEVLDCFAATNRALTVTDIVHRYERPQSSTSELLKTLVRMGILYRDPETRTYVPTPRLATLGRCLQPEPIGSGRLFAYMDRLGQAARCGVGLFGMLGTQVQLLHWASALPDPTPKIFCGVSTRLSSSAAGMLLLSALGGDRASKVLWRLHAEATKPAERFDLAEARQTVNQFERSGRGIGPSGFSADTQVAAILLPGFAGDRSLALGTVYLSSDGHDPLAMLATLEMGARAGFALEETGAPPFVSGVNEAG